MKVCVENLPTDCSYCDACHTRPYDNRCKIDGEKFCGIINEDVEVFYYHGDGRLDFCPLREIPKKLPVNPDLEDYDYGYIKGRNNCINEMIF